jgi:hypothetical protein
MNIINVVNDVVLTFDGGDEVWRLDRLTRLISRISQDTVRKISALHDHKGTLTVEWKSFFDEVDFARVRNSWDEENEISIENTWKMP